MAAASIGKKPLTIEAGHPDFFGTRHAARHFTPAETNPHKTAKTIVLGEKSKSQRGVDKINSEKKGNLAILADKGKELRLVTSYKPSSPRQNEKPKP